MNGYRYWVERHKLLLELAASKERLASLPETERLDRTMQAEAEFRVRLDALYAEAREAFEPAKTAAKA